MKREQLNIDYSHNGHAYRITLTAMGENFFQNAAQKKHLRGLEGEALVAGLLEYADGAIMRLQRYTDGKLNDGPNGEYAWGEFDKAGKLTDKSHYLTGERNNAANGEPAFQKFNSNGVVTYTVYYNFGQRNDGPKGQPAEQINDGQGNFVHVSRFVQDKRIHTFTAEELANHKQDQSAAPQKTKPNHPKMK